MLDWAAFHLEYSNTGLLTSKFVDNENILADQQLGHRSGERFSQQSESKPKDFCISAISGTVKK